MNSQSRMYDVGGVLLARPFKARRLGHFALWQTDLDMARRHARGHDDEADKRIRRKRRV